jgi:hypothetical protein|tara:strand:- start:1989 stop:2132 length:144 start_codon:yes stop_codon:yes gene_type:complete
MSSTFLSFRKKGGFLPDENLPETRNLADQKSLKVIGKLLLWAFMRQK